MKIGDPFYVPGLGLGVIEEYEGRYEGDPTNWYARQRWYARVRFDATRAALVPLSFGQVLQ